ncbi:MAG: exported protein of unknown function [Capsulimonas sp.]|nr:exported protein of unknown function [Capsulimonas sp.]
MNSDTLDVLLLMATYALWIFLPLLPAVLIYRLFPNTPVTLSGPFQSLTISAGGAFAAYFLTLIASIFLVKSIVLAVRNPPNSQWTVSGTLAVSDEHGRPHPVPQNGVIVSVQPSPVRISGDTIEADIWRNKSEWPRIRIEVPGYGAKTFTLDPSKVNFDVDEDNYRIVLREPLAVQRESPIEAGNALALKKINEISR